MKIRNIAMALVATVALLFSSCGKDLELKGTSWECNHTVDFTELFMEEMEEEMGEQAAQIVQMLGGKFLMDLSFIIDFTTDEAGAMTIDYRPSAQMNVPAQLKPMFDMIVETETSAMTYTFDGENGTITVDGDTQNFTYNSSDKTIVIPIPAGEDISEMIAMIGTDKLVFKQTK